MPSRARNKLSATQIAAFKTPNVYSDGGGLYLRVRKSGRSWFFIGTLAGKRIELGLGSALDVSLAKARKRAEEIREMLVDGLDPRVERAKAKIKVEEEPVVTFGVFAMELVDDIQDGFKKSYALNGKWSGGSGPATCGLRYRRAEPQSPSPSLLNHRRLVGVP